MSKVEKRVDLICADLDRRAVARPSRERQGQWHPGQRAGAPMMGRFESAALRPVMPIESGLRLRVEQDNGYEPVLYESLRTKPVAQAAAEIVSLHALSDDARLSLTAEKAPADKADAIIVRALDIVLSVMIMLFLAPLLIMVAAIIFCSDPGPVIFGHQRVGRNGAKFKCLKFRSMVMDADARLAEVLASDPVARQEWARDHKLRNDPRITPFGRFLRKSSIDELPQLINVLLGDMSLVGPRPIVAAEIVRYGRYFHHYCRVRPGLTGLWQISGRNDISYRRRVAADVAYSRSRTWRFDVQILMLTVPCVLLAKGSY